MTITAWAALAIIAFAAVFHLHWAFGGRRGFGVSLPQRPGGEPVLSHLLPLWRPAAFGVAVALVVLGSLIVAKSLPYRHGIPLDLLNYALGATSAAFVGRALIPNRFVGFFKSLRTTRWARYDTRLYSPLFLTLGLLLVVLASS